MVYRVFLQSGTSKLNGSIFTNQIKKFISSSVPSLVNKVKFLICVEIFILVRCGSGHASGSLASSLGTDRVVAGCDHSYSGVQCHLSSEHLAGTLVICTSTND